MKDGILWVSKLLQHGLSTDSGSHSMDMPSLALALNKMWSKNSDLGTVHVPPPIPDIPASLCLLFAKEKVKLGVPSSVY